MDLNRNLHNVLLLPVVLVAVSRATKINDQSNTMNAEYAGNGTEEKF